MESKKADINISSEFLIDVIKGILLLGAVIIMVTAILSILEEEKELGCLNSNLWDNKRGLKDFLRDVDKMKIDGESARHLVGVVEVERADELLLLQNELLGGVLADVLGENADLFDARKKLLPFLLSDDVPEQGRKISHVLSERRGRIVLVRHLSPDRIHPIIPGSRTRYPALRSPDRTDCPRCRVFSVDPAWDAIFATRTCRARNRRRP